MNKKILIVGHVNHGITPLTQAMKLALDSQNVCIVAPHEVSKPIGFEPEPIVFTNPYEGLEPITKITDGFVSRKERRKQERELKKRR